MANNNLPALRDRIRPVKSSEPTWEYGAPYLPISSRPTPVLKELACGHLPAAELDPDGQAVCSEPYCCGHDQSGGDCDYDCPRFANSHAGF